MKRFALACLIALFSGLTQAENTAQAPSITPTELQAMLQSGEGPVVIDVRSAAEFAEGHVPGAINIRFDEIATRIKGIDAPNGVALYCMVGPRARKGEAALLLSGYDAVASTGPSSS